MIDYARESSLELHNIFYELDDIIHYDFYAVMEADLATDASTAAAKDDNPAPSGDSDAAKRAEETKARLKAKQEAEAKTKNENDKLKSTTGFVAKIKALIDKIVELVKAGITKISEMIDKFKDNQHEKYMEKLRKAKSQNGFHAVEIENYIYDFKSHSDFANAVNASVNNTSMKLDNTVRQYSSQQGLSDSEKSELKRVVERSDEVYAYLAQKCGLKTVKGATPDSILTELQDKTRGDGEKKRFKIDEGYANKCEALMNDSRNQIKSIVNICNEAKSLAKKVGDNSKTITANPSTDTESNDLIIKRVNELGKFANFLVRASELMLKLEKEGITNSKIVLQRVYNFNAMGAKAAKKENTEEDKDSDDKTIEDKVDELDDSNVSA